MWLPLVEGWNSLVLREGDRCEAPGQGQQCQLNQHPRPHSKVYTTAGFLRLAWGALGKGTFRVRGKADVQQSNRSTEALGTLATLTKTAQDTQLAKLFGGWPVGQGLVVDRGYDCTPIAVRFGKLRGLIEPFAKYLVKEVLPDRPPVGELYIFPNSRR